YQKRFQVLYTAHLKKLRAEQTDREHDVRDSEGFKKLEQVWQEAQAAIAPQEKEIRTEVAHINDRLKALTDAFQEARGKVTALIYQLETADGTGAKNRLRQQVEKAKKGPFPVRLPVPDGSFETINFTYDELVKEFNHLKDRKAELATQLSELYSQPNALRQQLDAYLGENLVGLTEQQVDGLLRKMENFEINIRQIHVLVAGTFAVPEAVLVDRCESCHLAIREPVVLTRADMGGEAAFTSHPNPELLRIHDPERFGCSPCHGGNGRATTSVTKGHGRHKYWLWSLYHRENFEAGCQQCHVKDFVLEHAPVLSAGKELFRLRGCIGCHRFQGFDDERERLQALRQEIRPLQMQKAEYKLEIERSITAGDMAPTNEEARRLYDRADNLRLSISGLNAELEQLRLRARDLMREEKVVGPNLKDVRLKLRRDWIPVWLTNPHAWRPTTKMPRFRLQEDEVRAISAFIWQNGIKADLSRQSQGNPARGKELFETRGCLACHALGEGDQAVGSTFAANLSRVGEKANYDYLVRWVHNPRQRTRPYCPLEKRDLTPEDYARHGLPFQFDMLNSTCPNDGEELRVQNMTVMPSLRLTWEDARDIASFLMTQRQQDSAEYPPADYLDDSQLFERGKSLVRNYGCAGCHEIAGLEEEDRIGTELTNEGSKPIERLDFSLLTEKAKRGILPDGSKSPRGNWYDHKGFFEQKLADPAIFDQGKIKEPLERLRMPEPNLTEEDITALTTFLLGSVDPAFPEQYFYRPTDRHQDIQEGWWVVTKYNCMGCHQIRIGQPSVLMTLPRYQTPEGKEQLPPSLVGVGARLNPEWMADFLANPALSETDLDRNGVRSYLQARMPTFGFTMGELQKLVRFFAALSAQAQPYIPPRLEPLTNRERRMARQLFTHPAAPCLKCHATGDPARDRNATAPNFILVWERLKAPWTKRWIIDPAQITPGTAMPSGLFRREGDRWVFAGPTPESFQRYKGDHAELLVRYMFEYTRAEQRLLTRQMSSSSPANGPVETQPEKGQRKE
ncbi:MAG: hypothetical protein ACE5MH_06850, partial [Terriglobia bacterium]